MAKSLYAVTVIRNDGTPIRANVLAQPGSGVTALQAAINAALAAQSGSTFSTAAPMIYSGSLAVDAQIPAAVSPVTDGTPKAVFTVQFQAANPAFEPLNILANPQTSSGVTTPAVDLAITTATSTAGSGAVANGAVLIGNVDIDAT